MLTSEQQSMEHYLEDQYQIAKAATVTVAPTGEVILVCAENHDTLLGQHRKGTGRINYPAILPHSVRGAVSFCPQLCYTVPVIVQFYRSNLYV